jgi:hypothetical protein
MRLELGAGSGNVERLYVLNILNGKASLAPAEWRIPSYLFSTVFRHVQ